MMLQCSDIVAHSPLLSSIPIVLKGRNVQRRQGNDGFEEGDISILSECHSWDVGPPHVHVAWRYVGEPACREMKICVDKFLIFTVARPLIGNQPRNAPVYRLRHVHVSKRVNERGPWNLLQKLRREILDESSKILDVMDRGEFFKWRSISGADSLHESLLASTDNCIGIREVSCVTNCLDCQCQSSP